MSGSHAPVKPPHASAHPVSLIEALIFGCGVLVAMLVGVAASGMLPA